MKISYLKNGIEEIPEGKELYMLNIKVKTKDLKIYLEAHKKVVQDKSINVDILKNIYLQADPGRLSMITNNLDYGLSTDLPVDIINPGKVLIDFERLYSYVKLADEPDITIEELPDNECRIGKLTIQTATVGEFPVFPIVPAEAKIINPVDLNGFVQRLDLLKDVASKDEDRVMLTGFHIQPTKNAIVATNSYILGRLKLPDLHSGIEDFTIIPQILPLLKELTKKQKYPEATFSKDEKHFYVSGGDFVMFSRLLIGKYPEVDKLMPVSDFNSFIYDVPDTKALIKIIDKASKLIKDKDEHQIEFNFKDKTIKRHLKDIGTYEDTFPVTALQIPEDKDGNALEEFVINYSYVWLSIILKNIVSCQMVISEALRPMLITTAGKDQEYIIMPIRV